MDILADLRTRLRGIVAQRMQTDPAHDLAHLDRVWRNAQAIADDQADMAVLLAASYLHDLINLPKNDPNRHLASRQSAQESEPILRELSFSDVQIQATQHAIEAHSFSANIPPRTSEARILRDADRLDALGAIGIARTFAVAGALGRNLYDPEDPFAEAGHALAQTRRAQMLEFLRAFADETGHPVPATWETP